jgi:signal transduction histidine kinase
VLDLAKVEAGRIDLEPDEFDVRAAIGNAVTLVRERAARGGVRLGVAAAEGVDRWRADPRRFKQVLVNLLTNAVKFTPAGGSVEVRARVEADRLVVEVSDTGPGIAPEHLERIFEPFGRIGGRGEPDEGTGLGLSLVRRLVELHGGTVRVHSRPGEGSTFAFEIPQATA